MAKGGAENELQHENNYCGRRVRRRGCDSRMWRGRVGRDHFGDTKCRSPNNIDIGITAGVRESDAHIRDVTGHPTRAHRHRFAAGRACT